LSANQLEQFYANYVAVVELEDNLSAAVNSFVESKQYLIEEFNEKAKA
jgi:hypothetical protein